jgi:hypothetical protein
LSAFSETSPLGGFDVWVFEFGTSLQGAAFSALILHFSLSAYIKNAKI